MNRMRITLFGKILISMLGVVSILGFTFVTGAADKRNMEIKGASKEIYRPINNNLEFKNRIMSFRGSTNPYKALEDTVMIINFPSNSAFLKEEYYPGLNTFASIARTLGDLKIKIEGNTAEVTKDEYDVLDEILSLQRAKVIGEYLVKVGVDRDRLIIVGNGDKNPVGDNRTKLGRRLNRRTEIYFAKK